IRRVNQIPGARLGLICSMPHVTIIGTQYDKIVRDLEGEISLRLIEIPSRSLDGDWLHGYEEVLAGIASCMDVTGAAPDPKKVAFIGYLMDRTEHDHVANVEELERMMAALGLQATSVWLSGRPYEHLLEAKNAGTLIALPYGRKAAERLAQRTGAKLLQVGVPF